MLHASDCFHMISSADNAIVAGAIEISATRDAAHVVPPPSPDPGETVRLPLVERPIGLGMLALR